MCAPCFFDHVDKVLKNSFTTRLRQNILDNFTLAKQISIPKVSKQQVLHLSLDVEFVQQVFPVLRLHRIVSQVHKNLVELFPIL